MSERDFPALRQMVSDSVAGRAGRAAGTTAAAAIESSAAARRVRAVVQACHALPAEIKPRFLAAMLVAAGLTHGVLARWQAPHQTPLSAPAIAALALAAALVVLLAGRSISTAWAHSRTRRMWDALTK